MNNIEEIKLDLVQPGYKFTVHHDHSKWAVTKPDDTISEDHLESGHQGGSGVSGRNSTVRVTCIGDINRQEDQRKRGGGTVCFMHNENVWREYSRIVSEIQECAKMRNLKWKKIKYTISGEALVLV